MPTRTEIPVTELSRAGVAPPAQTDSDNTNGMLFNSNRGRVWLEIESADGSSQTVDFVIPTLIDDEPVAAKELTLAAGVTLLVGPFPTEFYNQSDDSVWINPSVDTTLKFRAYVLPSS